MGKRRGGQAGDEPGNLARQKGRSLQKTSPAGAIRSATWKSPALSAEITREECLKVNCRVAAREGDLGHLFSIISYSELLRSE